MEKLQLKETPKQFRLA